MDQPIVNYTQSGKKKVSDTLHSISGRPAITAVSTAGSYFRLS